MTDAQLTAILAALTVTGGSIAAAIKWAVGRLITAIDRNTEATNRNEITMARLEAKVDGWEGRSGVTSTEREDAIVAIRARAGDDMDTPPQRPAAKRLLTPPGGYSLTRPGTKKDR